MENSQSLPMVISVGTLIMQRLFIPVLLTWTSMKYFLFIAVGGSMALNVMRIFHYSAKSIRSLHTRTVNMPINPLPIH